VNPIHVELGKVGDEDDVDARIAFRDFRAALSHGKETAQALPVYQMGKRNEAYPS